jgi:hypothetical protein
VSPKNTTKPLPISLGLLNVIVLSNDSTMRDSPSSGGGGARGRGPIDPIPVHDDSAYLPLAVVLLDDQIFRFPPR